MWGEWGCGVGVGLVVGAVGRGGWGLVVGEVGRGGWLRSCPGLVFRCGGRERETEV